MKITFGITTLFDDFDRLGEVIDSINDQKIPDSEIIVIGPREFENYDNVKFINFSDNKNWITRKKNIIAEEAKHDNILIMHDYFLFDADWYNNYIEFGEDWDVCSNPQMLINGNRHFTDWVTWDHPTLPRWSMVDYDDWTQTKYMYQSGGYMFVKKKLMEEFPFNEKMMWGSAEDVEWSIRMRDTAKWVCNKNSIVRHNKVHRDAK